MEGTQHDHLPMKILRKTVEIADKWMALHQKLTKIEQVFCLKMKDYHPLLTHFDEIAKKHNINTNDSATTKMGQLDKLKEDFNQDTKEREGDSIDELVHNFKLIELLEVKELLRTKYEKRIDDLSNLANIGENELGPIYEKVIEVSGSEDWEELYSSPDKKEINRDMYLRLKL